MSKQFDSRAEYVAFWVCDQCKQHAVTRGFQENDNVVVRHFHRLYADLPEGWSVKYPDPVDLRSIVYCNECDHG